MPDGTLKARFDMSGTERVIEPKGPDKPGLARSAGFDQSVRLQSRIPPVLINRCAWDSAGAFFYESTGHAALLTEAGVAPIA